MHLARRIRSVFPPLPHARSFSVSHRHHAQTAFKPITEDEDNGSNSHAHHHRAEVHSHPRKGKQRADPFQEQYRFPQMGRNGGSPDPFEVLGVERSASEKEVKQQYYRLALMLHPDSAHPSSSHENFATLHRAYALLSQPDSRSSYLHTGRGWSSPSSRKSDSLEAMLRAEVVRRGGAGAGVRSSDAGRGAWGGYTGGDHWRSYGDAGFHGDVRTEPTYMSHPRFLGVLSVLLGVGAWVQYHRIDMVAETRREMLDQSHLNASHALAAARKEASLHGHERRDHIRRKVNEAQVLKEVEKQELEGVSMNS